MKIVVNVKAINADVLQKNTNKKKIINPYDLFAVYQALALKKEVSVEVYCLLMCQSDQRIAAELKSLGVDRVVFLSDPVFSGADTYATSLVLAKAIEKSGNVDYVFCGKRTMDGETGQVGPQIAVRHKCEFVGNIETVTYEHGALYAKKAGRKTELLRIDNRCVVLSFRNCITTDISLSLFQLKKMNQTEYEEWDHKTLDLMKENCGLIGSKTKVKSSNKFESGTTRLKKSVDWSNNCDKEMIIRIIKGDRKIV